MGNNKDPNVKRPGENEEGKFHYNPGNMAGKEMGIRKMAERPAHRSAGRGFRSAERRSRVWDGRCLMSMKRIYKG